MPSTNQLSRADEILMIAIVVLGDNAYSTTIKQEISSRARKKVTVGSLWVSLDQLADKGLIRKKQAETTGGRGGRPRVFYRLTPRGLRALIRVREYQEKLWKDVPDLEEYEAA